VNYDKIKELLSELNVVHSENGGIIDNGIYERWVKLLNDAMLKDQPVEPVLWSKPALIEAIRGKACTKVYTDYEKGYNKALTHIAELLQAAVPPTDDRITGPILEQVWYHKGMADDPTEYEVHDISNFTKDRPECDTCVPAVIVACARHNDSMDPSEHPLIQRKALRKAVDRVLGEYNIPSEVRAILEMAYFSPLQTIGKDYED
jgi:hypothetical protein